MRYLPLGLVGLLGRPAWAVDLVYITDLSIYTMLVPCAQTAVSYPVGLMTLDNCPDGATELQSCICSRYYSSIGNKIASSVTEDCGVTATEDQASVATVYSAYCNQDVTFTFPEPSVSVTDYIDDIAEFSYLAPCASSELSYVAHSMTFDDCPPEAAYLATCMCQKQQNSLMISKIISTSVRTACSSLTADISSAQAFFSAYCNMLNGTSSFPSASNPPGDMSYYITDMPQYASLAPCAATAVSYGVFSNTYQLCPAGPQLLASCACLKDSMSARVSSVIASRVRDSCSSPAADITSALNIFATYCSAAANELAVTGVENSVAQTAPSGVSSTSLPRATSTATGSGSSGSNDSDSDSDSSSSSSSPSKTPVIVGAVVGVVGGVCLLATATFLVFRHVRQQKKPALSHDDYPGGKPELGGTAVAKPPTSPSPDSSTQTGIYAQSPAISSASPQPYPSAHEMYSPDGSGHELPGQSQPQQAELHGNQAVPQADSRPVQTYAELDGQDIVRT